MLLLPSSKLVLAAVRERCSSSAIACALGGLWLAGVVAGSCFLWSYANTPGDEAEPPKHWPRASALPRSSYQPTLVLFAHPRCPCTVATLRELERMLARCPGRLHTVISFTRPSGVDHDWVDGRCLEIAMEIPDVHTLIDAHGREAALFRSTTSGHVCLYDVSGQLVFHGGLTRSRGHEGTSTGHEAILTFVSGRRGATRSNVFGCPLHPQHAAQVTP
jgi:hypothetical protein